MRNSELTIVVPLLPPSLNTYRRWHWAKMRRVERTWKENILGAWASYGRPVFRKAKVSVTFYFGDRRTRDLDNFIGTGAKLIGDALKGLVIPDDSPEHLISWDFSFRLDPLNPRTSISVNPVN